MAGTKRAEQKARTREAVIVAARELFHHEGYEAVTIRQVAKKAGMSTGSIFASFTGKADLFAAAMDEPAPDIAAFLGRLANARVSSPEAAASVLEDFTIAAERLRRHLIGHHA